MLQVSNISPNENYHPENTDEQEIVERPNYLNNVLISGVRDIDIAIMSERKVLDSADNLISNIPKKWYEQIKPDIDIEKDRLNTVVLRESNGLRRGINLSQKKVSMERILRAQIDYARAIKKIIITVIDDNVKLFQTRDKIPNGYMSLWNEQDEPESDV